MRSLLLIVLVVNTYLVNGQFNTQFPDSMAKWVNIDVSYDLSDNQVATDFQHSTVEFTLNDQDTLISNLQYQKLFYQDSLYVGGLRKVQDQVYFVHHSDSLEHLLYDFGAELNESVSNVITTSDGNTLYDNSEYNLEDFTVYYVDSVLCADNTWRRRLGLYGSLGSMAEWIEGVGNSFGLFWSAAPNVSNYRIRLANLCVNDEAIYVHDIYNDPIGYFLESPLSPCTSNFLNEVKEIPSQVIKFYPVPARDILNIEGVELKKSDKVLIFNSLGYEITPLDLMINGKIQLDVSGLECGIYFIQIKSADYIFSKKIVIEK